MVIRPGVYRRFIVLTCFITVILLQKLCLELLLVRAVLQQIVQKLIRCIRNPAGVSSITALQIVNGIVDKRICHFQLGKTVVTVGRIIHRIHTSARAPHDPIHHTAETGLCCRTGAHHFTGDAGKISIIQIRTILEQAVDVRNTVTVCQTGKIRDGQLFAALKGAAQMCNTRIVAVKFGSGLHNHSLQIFKVLKQTVAVCRQHSLEHDHNMLNTIFVKVANSSSTVAQINILCRVIKKIALGGLDHTVDEKRAAFGIKSVFLSREV